MCICLQTVYFQSWSYIRILVPAITDASIGDCSACALRRLRCMLVVHKAIRPFSRAVQRQSAAKVFPRKAPRMDNHMEAIQVKMKYIDELLTKLENKEALTVVAMLHKEIEDLRALNTECQSIKDGKKVVRRDEKCGKSRYYLKDGSVYVVKNHEYRYLYDSKSKVVTYEFANGQVERTFANGLKEIRQRDGSIVIKSSAKDYEYIN
ncbi:hypothetical protein PAPHI01_0719 [Pancytospora philotis]|nr:hypothetical protein PAPHI01_0719 [Pancytospora philotis]